MKCENCGKGRPKLWNKDGHFCNEACYREWKSRIRYVSKAAALIITLAIAYQREVLSEI